MEGLLNLLQAMPEYVRTLFTEHMVFAIIGAVIFVFVLFFNIKVAKVLRTLFVLAIIAFGGIGAVQRNWEQVCFCVIVLLILLIIRIIAHAIHSIRTDKRNRRIEERALERAAKRRGSWKNKKGYSGERKPIVEPEYVPEKMDAEEIDKVIKYEKVDAPKNTITPPETEVEETVVEKIKEPVTAKAEDAAADVKEEAAHVVDDTEEAAGKVEAKAKEVTEKVADATKETAEKVADDVKETTEKVADHVKETAEKVEEKVKDVVKKDNE